MHNTALTIPSKSDEYLTPLNILQFSRLLLGGNIELDPCASNLNPTDAQIFYTKQIDGLTQPWCGNLFINPPFSRNLEFAQKFNSELISGNISKAVYLVKTDFRTKWYSTITTHSDYKFDHYGYVKFGNAVTPAPFGIQLIGFNLARKDVENAINLCPEFTAHASHLSLEHYLRSLQRNIDISTVAKVFGVSNRLVTLTAHKLGLKTIQLSIRDGDIVTKERRIIISN